MKEKIRFGNFEFDPVHGLLVSRNGSEQPVETRLPPQPANLLALLLEKQPEIVNRQEIRELLWPDVQVDFDRSLHFCIRQIRSALGESANEPRFIETIPRRGYRWMIPPETGPPPQVAETEMADSLPATIDTESVSPNPVNRRIVLFVLFTTFVVVLGAIVVIARNSGQTSPPTSEQAVRIAIMPFQPNSIPPGPFANNSIATDLVELLTNQSSHRLEVIGPTTTAEFAIPASEIRRLIEEYKIEYVINGKFVDEESRHRLLAEIIRAGDGAHIWVRYFQADAPGTAADSIANGMLESLTNPSPDRRKNN